MSAAIYRHAVIWIDHHEARVFHFNANNAAEALVRPSDPVRHIHHKANSIGSGHAEEDQKFLHSVAEAVADAAEVLITGPANEKDELAKHLKRHDPALAKAIVGTEKVDHPTDPQLVALARRYFKAADRMRS